jgi:anaerobic dimethyl sulfoxide reductase subunit C (anchor subunit)
MLKEWPLVAFTVLGQTAVGLFWCFHLPFLVRMRTPSYGWRVTWLVTLALVFLIASLAAFVSFFHLRHPLRARFVLSNVRTSWLSREILGELAFMALVALSGWLAWTRMPSPGLMWALLAAACLAGGFFLVSMTRLYMLRTLSAWSDVHTPLSFLLAALVLGALATELVVRVFAGPGVFELDLMRSTAFLLAAEILLVVLIAPRHGILGARASPSLRPPANPPRSLHAVRLACLAVGFVCVVADIATGAGHIMNEKGAGAALILAFAFVLAGEAAGRFHFYGLVGRAGDPAR